MSGIPGFLKSRGALVIGLAGALLAIAVVLQAAESIWHTVSPPEPYTPPPPTTDPEAIRQFLETARPKITIEGGAMRVGNAPGSSYIHFDAEDAQIEELSVCLEEGHDRVMEELLAETTEIPGGRFARARFRDQVSGEFRVVFHDCLEGILGVPAVPSTPGASAREQPPE
ncbi:MAG: hypothetical protein R3344_06535 [Acidobacteriota bacterium]|nr:hypothetical protein [Acidobacteriota bacterium]